MKTVGLEMWIHDQELAVSLSFPGASLGMFLVLVAVISFFWIVAGSDKSGAEEGKRWRHGPCTRYFSSSECANYPVP